MGAFRVKGLPVPAWTNGLGRVRRAPALVLVLWICSLSITIPPAFALNAAIAAHLGSSIEADAAADGTNYDWLQEFRAQASPLGRTLRSDVIGFAAVMDNASALADVNFRPLVVVMSAIVFASLVWFLSPGIICRLAIDTPLSAGSILGIAGTVRVQNGEAWRRRRRRVRRAVLVGACLAVRRRVRQGDTRHDR